MLLSSLAVILGLVLLTYGADRFVIGASGLARSLGLSPMIIGLTVVAFATSAPEMLVAAVAALEGSPGMAVGNAVGSNIANIGLVLGVTALISPLVVNSATIRREFPIMFAALFLTYALIFQGDLNRVDGIVLAIGLVVIVALTVYLGRKSGPNDPLVAELENEIPDSIPLGYALFWLAVGLAMLIGGSQAMVYGAVEIARALGVSDLVIGLTIVAVGTSLPELAASVMSALKGEQDIALGNVIGSNMFNILGVMAVPGLLSPASVDSEVLQRDYPFMLLMSFLMFFMAYGLRRAQKITRLNGAILLIGFMVYQVILFKSVA